MGHLGLSRDTFTILHSWYGRNFSLLYHTQNDTKIPRSTRIPCFTPLCSNAPPQYTSLLILRPLNIRLTRFGWLHSITLNPTYSTFVNRNIIFDIRLFYLRPAFQEHKYSAKLSFGVGLSVRTGERTLMAKRPVHADKHVVPSDVRSFR